MITKEMIRQFYHYGGETTSTEKVDAAYELISGLIGLNWKSVEDARKAVSIKMDEITTDIFFHPDKTQEILKKHYGFLLEEVPA